MVDVAVDGLMQELRLSPAVCELIRQQHGAVTHNSPVLPVGGEQCEPPYISSEVLQLTTQTLFKHCQQKTCMSSDTWLAIQSLSEKNPVLLQVHRYVLNHMQTRRAVWCNLIELCEPAGASWLPAVPSFRSCFPLPGQKQALITLLFQQKRYVIDLD